MQLCVEIQVCQLDKVSKSTGRSFSEIESKMVVTGVQELFAYHELLESLESLFYLRQLYPSIEVSHQTVSKLCSRLAVFSADFVELAPETLRSQLVFSQECRLQLAV